MLETEAKALLAGEIENDLSVASFINRFAQEQEETFEDVRDKAAWLQLPLGGSADAETGGEGGDRCDEPQSNEKNAAHKPEHSVEAAALFTAHKASHGGHSAATKGMHQLPHMELHPGGGGSSTNGGGNHGRLLAKKGDSVDALLDGDSPGGLGDSSVSKHGEHGTAI